MQKATNYLFSLLQHPEQYQDAQSNCAENVAIVSAMKAMGSIVKSVFMMMQLVHGQSTMNPTAYPLVLSWH